MITHNQLESLRDLILLDNSWLIDHITLRFDDRTDTVYVEVWDVNDTDYKELKENGENKRETE